MPFFLRKAPNRDLYWVVSARDPKEHLSYEPMPYDRAIKQLKAVTISEIKRGKYKY